MYYLFEYLCAKFTRCKTGVKLLTIKFVVKQESCTFVENLI